MCTTLLCTIPSSIVQWRRRYLTTGGPLPGESGLQDVVTEVRATTVLPYDKTPGVGPNHVKEILSRFRPLILSYNSIINSLIIGKKENCFIDTKLIYAIQYVGQTENNILTRFNSHHYDISHNSDTTIARHFNKCPRHAPAKFECLSISILSFVHALPNTKAGQAETDMEEKC